MLSKMSTGKKIIVYYFYFNCEPFEFCLAISTVAMFSRYPGDQDSIRRRHTGNKRCEEPVLHLYEQGRAAARQGNMLFPCRENTLLWRYWCILISNVLRIFPLQRIYNENCNFKEVFLENYFNAYSSARWTKNGREMFIALSQKGRPMRGKKTRREHVASHFIPMKCREGERRADWVSRGVSSWKLCMMISVT